MNVVGRGATHDRINVLVDGLDIGDASFDEVFIHSLLKYITMATDLCLEYILLEISIV